MNHQSLETHPDAQELGAYHDGELRGYARAGVEMHVATCPRCRRSLEEIDRLDAALHAMPVLQPRGERRDAVVQRTPAWRRSMPRVAWRLGAALAVLAALLAGLLSALAPHPAGLLPVSAPLQASRTPGGPHEAAAPSHPQPLSGAKRAGDASVSGSSKASQAAPPHASLDRMPRSAGTPPATDARLIARTGDVELRVPDVQRAFGQVSAIAVRAQGYVSDSTNNAAARPGHGYAATLTLRVPAQGFQATMDRLAALPGSMLLAEHSRSTDITGSYQDLQAHLAALQSARAQLTGLMRKAGTIHDAIGVLDRLTDVNTQIDGVQGQIMASANGVMLSTITVQLAPTPRKHVVVPPPRRHHPAAGWQPGRDLAAALGNLTRALQTLATISIYAVVYLAVPAMLAGLAFAARAAHRRTWRNA